MFLASHRDLIVAAGFVHKAALHEEFDELHSALRVLRDDLVRHISAEEEDVRLAPGAGPSMIRAGQERLVRLLDDLLFTAAYEGATSACVPRAAQFEHLVRRQALLEAALHIPPTFRVPE